MVRQRWIAGKHRGRRFFAGRVLREKYQTVVPLTLCGPTIFLIPRRSVFGRDLVADARAGQRRREELAHGQTDNVVVFPAVHLGPPVENCLRM